MDKKYTLEKLESGRKDDKYIVSGFDSLTDDSINHQRRKIATILV